MSAHVLVTGFGPFGDVRINASGLIAERVGADEGVRAMVLPTAFGAAREAVARAVREDACVGFVALGVCGGSVVRVERRAAGVVMSMSPDVAGEVWYQRELGAEQRAWIDVTALATAIGARVSDDCGGYVCNATYHAALSAAGAGHREGGKPGVFLHVPRDVGESGLVTVERLVRGAIEFVRGAAIVAQQASMGVR